MKRYLNAALELGIENGFFQEGETASGRALSRHLIMRELAENKKNSHKMEGGRYLRTGAYEKEKYL